MSFLDRLLGRAPDPRERLRPLWLRTIELARAPQWYAECGVSDSLAGRFDMVCLVTALILLRLENSDGMRAESALLTELFVEDMEGQLRELGTI